MKFAYLVSILVLCFFCSCATTEKPSANDAMADIVQTEEQAGPKTAEEFFISGAWFANIGDIDSAIRDYTQAIRLNPDYEAAYAYRALSYRSKGDFDRAIADFTQVIRINPNDAIGYFSRGMLYNDKGDYDRAIADFNRALQLEPEYLAEIYYGRGVAYNGKRDYDRAVEDWETVLQMNPVHSNAKRNLEILRFGRRD
jgi:tetratricopeptide (TPR) repeat protein